MNLENDSEKPQRKNLIQRIQSLIEKTRKAKLKPLEGTSEQAPEKESWAARAGADHTQAAVTRWIRPALILFGLLMAFNFGKGLWEKHKPSLEKVVNENKQNKDEIVPIKVYKAGRYNYEDPLNALGTIKGAMEFKLSFEIPGVISSINYREGERYEEGALLMSLRQDDILLQLKKAQAEFNKADSESKIAEDKLREHEKLFSMGAIPKSTLDKAKLELDSKKYEMEASRLQMKAHESMLEKTNLYAPSSGMLGQLNVEEGETITQNTMLGTHVMVEYVFAEFGVGEKDVNKIALGQKSRVFIDAYPDKTFDGVIENVAPLVTGTSRTATVRVRIENPEGLLLPGMFSRIRILLYSKKNTLVVPTDALQGKEGEQFVFLVKPDKESVEKRPIAIGYTRPDYSQVDAGIAEGDLIAVTNLERLEDGKKVRVSETQDAELQA